MSKKLSLNFFEWVSLLSQIYRVKSTHPLWSVYTIVSTVEIVKTNSIGIYIYIEYFLRYLSDMDYHIYPEAKDKMKLLVAATLANLK